MKRLFCAAFLSGAFSVNGVGFSYRIETDHTNALYTCGHAATFTVTVADADGQMPTGGCVKARLDNYGTRVRATADWDLSKTNVFVLAGTMDRPGFLRLRLEAANTKTRDWGVAFSRNKIVKGSPSPEDFDAYWQDEVERLERTVPLDAQVERIPARCTSEFGFFRISFATFGRRVWGYMSVPTDTSRAPYPVDVEVSAAGFGDHSNNLTGSKDAIRAFFSVFPFPIDYQWKEHGVKAEYDAMTATITKRDGFSYFPYAGSNRSREEFFYHPVVLGLNRAVDWLAARPDADRTRIRYRGTSQGGGMGVILCGLNRNFTRAAFFVPAMCDMLGYHEGGRQSGWPQLVESQADAAGRSAAEKVGAYFDGANFASRITCPVRFVVGFSDASCAPAAVYATYNEVRTDKAIVNGIGMTHSVRREYYRQLESWLEAPDPQRLKPAFPKTVKCIAVVSPASPLDGNRLERGVKMLESAGFRVKVTPTARTAEQAPAEARAKDLMDVWLDPEVDVIIASRGGLGGEQVLPLLDWEKMRRHPKRFVGFSNMTCLLNAMLAHGVSHPIAGPNLGSLERVSTPDSIVRLGKTVAGEALDPVRLRPVNAAAKRGTGCCGKPMGGHVLVFSRKTPDPHFPDPTGRIVFLEIGGGGCSAEAVRIWIGDLEKRGVFAKCAGVVLCDFLECGTPEEVRAMLQGFADGVTVPVYAGYPFGHAPRSYAIDFEREAVVSPSGELSFDLPELLTPTNVVRRAFFAPGGDVQLKYVCELTGKKNPKVLLFPTAERDRLDKYDFLIKWFGQWTDDVRPVLLFDRKVKDIAALRREILSADVLWFTGGMTEWLVDRVAFYHLEEVIREAYRRGTILCGYSAGSIFLSYAGFNDFTDGRYDFQRGLGIVPAYFGPHYAEEVWKGFDARLASEPHFPGAPDVAWSVEDGAGVLFENEQPSAKSFFGGARAFRFERKEGVWSKEAFPEPKRAKTFLPGTWCSLGTSITWYNDHTDEGRHLFTHGYQDRVRDVVAVEKFVNCGIDGGVLGQQTNLLVKADYYTVEHGINDWGHSTPVGSFADYRDNTDNGTFYANYRVLVDAIRKLNPKAKIVLCTPRKGYGFGTYLPPRSDDTYRGIRLCEYAEAVRRIARAEGFAVADFFETCGTNDELAGLSIDVALHPNDAGYQRMADELLKTFSKFAECQR